MKSLAKLMKKKRVLLHIFPPVWPAGSKLTRFELRRSIRDASRLQPIASIGVEVHVTQLFLNSPVNNRAEMENSTVLNFDVLQEHW